MTSSILYILLTTLVNRIDGVMVSVLASSAVDRGFKAKTIKLVFVASPNH